MGVVADKEYPQEVYECSEVDARDRDILDAQL
jgi:hypothetical protein